jgi:hypothetical protein
LEKEKEPKIGWKDIVEKINLPKYATNPNINLAEPKKTNMSCEIGECVNPFTSRCKGLIRFMHIRCFCVTFRGCGKKICDYHTKSHELSDSKTGRREEIGRTCQHHQGDLGENRMPISPESEC